MLKYLPVLFIFFLAACKSDPGFDMSEEEIDEYVLSVHDTTIFYDIIYGPRFSKENGQDYRATEFSLNDTTVLFFVEQSTEFTNLEQNIYFKDGLPIYMEEILYEFSEESYLVTERKFYFTGHDILKSYERSSEYEEEIGDEKFEELSEVSFSQFDFDQPKNAVLQEGEFKMKFDSFLIINPESYLVLENSESGWGVALFIIEGDMLLDEMFANSEDYRGKTIFFNHEFKMMSGVERMIYRGGIVKEG